MRGREDQIEFSFTFGAPTVVPQGDGSILIKPGKPQSRLSPAQFASAIGVSRSAVYHYIDSGLLPQEFVRRTGPVKIFILAEACHWWNKRWNALGYPTSDAKEPNQCDLSGSSNHSS